MQVAVVTLFPEFVEQVLSCGITGRAAERGLLDVKTWNPRDFADNRHRKVDDSPYGGGPGMVMSAAPLTKAIEQAQQALPAPCIRVLLSPQGIPLTQGILARYQVAGALVLVAGRYEGVDERLMAESIDEEISLGDFVLSGGEIPAMAVIDGLARLLPGALGDENSALEDSFIDGLLDYPHYTRPEGTGSQQVPEPLTSGDHARIRRWRQKQALGRTLLRRPEMLKSRKLSGDEMALLQEFIDDLPATYDEAAT